MISTSVVLITGALNLSSEQLESLREHGDKVLFVGDEKGELPEEAYEADIVVCNNLFSFHRVEDFPSLKSLYLTSSGTDRLPLDALSHRGVQVYPARGIYGVPIAEWVVMQILNIYKRTRFFESNQARRVWEKNRDIRELTGSTVVVVGFGEIGQEVAQRLRPFGVEIVGVRRNRFESVLADECIAIEELDEFLPRADVVVLAVPLSAQSHHLFNESRMRLLKDNAVIVNVSRGQVLDEGSLLQLLQENKFSGVALDVFSLEPLSNDSPLWESARVIVSPHNSFVSDQTQARMFERIMTLMGRRSR